MTPRKEEFEFCSPDPCHLKKKAKSGEPDCGQFARPKVQITNRSTGVIRHDEVLVETPRTKIKANKVDGHAPIGPSPLLLTRAEADELYNLLSSLLSCLDELGVPHILAGGSLLGAIRSKSILSNDDDVVIAIIDNSVENEAAMISHYTRMQEHLPALLRKAAKKRNKVDTTRSPYQRPIEYTYHKRPWVACDRVKSSAAPRVWIDIFVLCRYDSRQDVIDVISLKDNGDNQPESYVNHILCELEESPILGAFPSSGSPTSIGQTPPNGYSQTIHYPIFHFDNRKAIELWPRNFFTTTELFPVQKSFTFGPLTHVPGPHLPVQALQRFFGSDCFSHNACSEYSQGKDKTKTTTSEDGRTNPLSNEQYSPVQHSKRNKRIWSDHDKFSLEPFLLSPEKHELSKLSPLKKSSLTRTKSFLAMIPASSPILTSSGTENSTLIQLRQQPETVSSSPVASPSLITKDKQQQSLKWFSATLRRYTHGNPDVPIFDKELRQVMEPYIVKARLRREQTLQNHLLNDKNSSLPLSISQKLHIPYKSLRSERPFLFDVETYPLHQILADTIQVKDLSLIHEQQIQDKQALFDGLIHRATRRKFHACYDNFVTSFCIPLLHSMAMEKNLFDMNKSICGISSSAITYRYQAFPCIRVIRPDECSIGPHCDVAHGHSIGNINFHIPLTPSFGTNALFAESHPGKEDWHPFACRTIGLGYMFDGARCLHWTMENTTNRTRVSLDFRISISRSKVNIVSNAKCPTKEGNERVTSPLQGISALRNSDCADEHDGDVDNLLCSSKILKDQYSIDPGYYDEAIIDTSITRCGWGRADPIVMKIPKTPGVGGVSKEGNLKNALYDPDKRVGFPFC